jgi:RNA-binding protein
MSLSASQRRYLRGLAHDLKPVIQLGNKGVTPTLLTELDLSLSHHELIKVKIPAEDRADFAVVAQQLAESSQAELVQTIGRTAVYYRRNADEPKPALVCPCHYSTFDVRRGAVPVFGPAARALPQLPLAVDGRGFLVADGPLSGSVGPSYLNTKTPDDLK